jgi:hypothetical protein
MTGIFFSSKVWTPSLVLAEQALCHLSHTSITMAYGLPCFHPVKRV